MMAGPSTTRHRMFTQDNLKAVSEKSFTTLLLDRAQQWPSTRVYTWLVDGESEGASLSYADLDRRARSIAGALQSLKCKRKRALLLYGPGLAFIEALFGCFYAGVTAVPAYAPRSNCDHSRIEAILQDSDCDIALTTGDLFPGVRQMLDHAYPDIVCLAT